MQKQCLHRCSIFLKMCIRDRGYTYHYGMAKNIGMIGNQGICSDLVARPYMKNDLNISVMCLGARMHTKAEDGELGIGMPIRMLWQLIEGVVNTINPSMEDKRKEDLLERLAEDVYKRQVLEGTNGVLHVSQVYLNELLYKDLEVTFSNGMVADYSCKNFEHELENKEYFLDNVLYRHPTLPLGEFAIGTNTTAYVAAKKYNIADKMPILIAEKMGPHFAVGDT